MKVKDAMCEQAVWCAPDRPVSEVARLMREEDIGAVPVGENDRLVGMVTDRDIALHGFSPELAPSATTVADVISKGVIYCNETQDLEDAIRLMENHQVRRLPVINQAKRLVGMLSLGDISHAVSHELSGMLLRSVSDHHSD
jgi:CBS domain-containing protein